MTDVSEEAARLQALRLDDARILLDEYTSEGRIDALTRSARFLRYGEHCFARSGCSSKRIAHEAEREAEEAFGVTVDVITRFHLGRVAESAQRAEREQVVRDVGLGSHVWVWWVNGWFPGQVKEVEEPEVEEPAPPTPQQVTDRQEAGSSSPGENVKLRENLKALGVDAPGLPAAPRRAKRMLHIFVKGHDQEMDVWLEDGDPRMRFFAITLQEDIDGHLSRGTFARPGEHVELHCYDLRERHFWCLERTEEEQNAADASLSQRPQPKTWRWKRPARGGKAPKPVGTVVNGHPTQDQVCVLVEHIGISEHIHVPNAYLRHITDDEFLERQGEALRTRSAAHVCIDDALKLRFPRTIFRSAQNISGEWAFLSVQDNVTFHTVSLGHAALGQKFTQRLSDDTMAWLKTRYVDEEQEEQGDGANLENGGGEGKPSHPLEGIDFAWERLADPGVISIRRGELHVEPYATVDKGDAGKEGISGTPASALSLPMSKAERRPDAAQEVLVEAGFRVLMGVLTHVFLVSVSAEYCICLVKTCRPDELEEVTEYAARLCQRLRGTHDGDDGESQEAQQGRLADILRRELEEGNAAAGAFKHYAFDIYAHQWRRWGFPNLRWLDSLARRDLFNMVVANIHVQGGFPVLMLPTRVVGKKIFLHSFESVPHEIVRPRNYVPDVDCRPLPQFACSDSGVTVDSSEDRDEHLSTIFLLGAAGGIRTAVRDGASYSHGPRSRPEADEFLFGRDVWLSLDMTHMQIAQKEEEEDGLTVVGSSKPGSRQTATFDDSRPGSRGLSSTLSPPATRTQNGPRAASRARSRSRSRSRSASRTRSASHSASPSPHRSPSPSRSLSWSPPKLASASSLPKSSGRLNRFSRDGGTVSSLGDGEDLFTPISTHRSNAEPENGLLSRIMSPHKSPSRATSIESGASSCSPSRGVSRGPSRVLSRNTSRSASSLPGARGPSVDDFNFKSKEPRHWRFSFARLEPGAAVKEDGFGSSKLPRKAQPEDQSDTVLEATLQDYIRADNDERAEMLDSQTTYLKGLSNDAVPVPFDPEALRGDIRGQPWQYSFYACWRSYCFENAAGARAPAKICTGIRVVLQKGAKEKPVRGKRRQRPLPHDDVRHAFFICIEHLERSGYAPLSWLSVEQCERLAEVCLSWLRPRAVGSEEELFNLKHTPPLFYGAGWAPLYSQKLQPHAILIGVRDIVDARIAKLLGDRHAARESSARPDYWATVYDKGRHLHVVIYACVNAHPKAPHRVGVLPSRAASAFVQRVRVAEAIVHAHVWQEVSFPRSHDRELLWTNLLIKRWLGMLVAHGTYVAAREGNQRNQIEDVDDPWGPSCDISAGFKGLVTLTLPAKVAEGGDESTFPDEDESLDAFRGGREARATTASLDVEFRGAPLWRGVTSSAWYKKLFTHASDCGLGSVVYMLRDRLGKTKVVAKAPLPLWQVALAWEASQWRRRQTVKAYSDFGRPEYICPPRSKLEGGPGKPKDPPPVRPPVVQFVEEKNVPLTAEQALACEGFVGGVPIIPVVIPLHHSLAFPGTFPREFCARATASLVDVVAPSDRRPKSQGFREMQRQDLRSRTRTLWERYQTKEGEVDAIGEFSGGGSGRSGTAPSSLKRSKTMELARARARSSGGSPVAPQRGRRTASQDGVRKRPDTALLFMNLANRGSRPSSVAGKESPGRGQSAQSYLSPKRKRMGDSYAGRRVLSPLKGKRLAQASASDNDESWLAGFGSGFKSVKVRLVPLESMDGKPVDPATSPEPVLPKLPAFMQRRAMSRMKKLQQTNFHEVIKKKKRASFVNVLSGLGEDGEGAGGASGEPAVPEEFDPDKDKRGISLPKDEDGRPKDPDPDFYEWLTDDDESASDEYECDICGRIIDTKFPQGRVHCLNCAAFDMCISCFQTYPEMAAEMTHLDHSMAHSLEIIFSDRPDEEPRRVKGIAGLNYILPTK
mmetsp:Transcript_4012/g.11687  ORF Transcript_4012/g.11687 Transcript_4012/m.11687 type:complete len:1944 (-) Transcript_4012:54-5885(-)